LSRFLLALLLLLPGCKLVDQTTFNPQAGKRPVIAPPPPPPPGPPAPDANALLTVHFPLVGDPAADVAKAVAAARARKPDVDFDVVEVSAATPPADVGKDAAEVARMITAQGVPASRIKLAARPSPGAGREVRVYVH
jgi:hypothetical protein